MVVPQRTHALSPGSAALAVERWFSGRAKQPEKMASRALCPTTATAAPREPSRLTRGFPGPEGSAGRPSGKRGDSRCRSGGWSQAGPTGNSGRAEPGRPRHQGPALPDNCPAGRKPCRREPALPTCAPGVTSAPRGRRQYARPLCLTAPAPHPGPAGRGAAAAGGWRGVRTWQAAGAGVELPGERWVREPEAGPAAAPGAANSGGE